MLFIDWVMTLMLLFHWQREFRDSFSFFLIIYIAFITTNYISLWLSSLLLFKTLFSVWESLSYHNIHCLLKGTFTLLCLYSVYKSTFILILAVIRVMVVCAEVTSNHDNIVIITMTFLTGMTCKLYIITKNLYALLARSRY